MSFTGTEDQSISLADAAVLTKNYRDAQTGTGYIIGEYFGKEILMKILTQTDCVGIRAYYAIRPEGSGTAPCLVLTGVTADENDMENGVLAERGVLCPPTCSSANALNSDQ